MSFLSIIIIYLGFLLTFSWYSGWCVKNKMAHWGIKDVVSIEANSRSLNITKISSTGSSLKSPSVKNSWSWHWTKISSKMSRVLFGFKCKKVENHGHFNDIILLTFGKSEKLLITRLTRELKVYDLLSVMLTWNFIYPFYYYYTYKYSASLIWLR